MAYKTAYKAVTTLRRAIMAHASDPQRLVCSEDLLGAKLGEAGGAGARFTRDLVYGIMVQDGRIRGEAVCSPIAR